MPSRRIERINAELRRIISRAVLEDVKDPRIGFITITRVEASDDLSHALVRFSVLGEVNSSRTSLKALNKMTGFFQKKIAKALKIRNTPLLKFMIDEGTDHYFKISQLIDSARASDPIEEVEVSEETKESTGDSNETQSES